MAKQIFLHIGTHKTGSTSIQGFLRDHHKALSEDGIAVYGRDRGAFNNTDLYLASLREERDSFAKLRKGNIYGREFAEETATRVRAFLSEATEPKVVMTTEGLALLRYADEIERLRHVVDAGKHDVSIILYVRNKADYLRSYRQQIAKYAGRAASTDKSSVLYAEDDSWIADFDSLIETYESGFPGRVNVIDYDREMAHRGNVIPSFLAAIGAETTADVDGYFQNVSAAP
jgi:hypothetical protein